MSHITLRSPRLRVIVALLVVAALTVIARAPQVHAAQVCPSWGSKSNVGNVNDGRVREASGIAASRTQSGIWWIHNDSGDSPSNRVFAITQSGSVRAEVRFSGASVSDFEDIAIGWGPDANKDYIYAADIGDNGQGRDHVRIHRFPEPDVSGGGTITIPSSDVETFLVRYARPDGNGTWKRNAEGFAVDPASGDLVLLEKVKNGSSVPLAWVYRIRHLDLKEGQFLEAEPMVQIKVTYNQVNPGPATAADISPDGRTFYAKNGAEIYAWVREPGETLYDALGRNPTNGCLGPISVGEAVGVSADNTFLLSIPEGNNPPLTKVPVSVPAANMPSCEGVAATIAGTSGADLIRGTGGDDVIVGFDKKDLIYGLAGNDRICGDEGQDDLRGGKDDDVLFGGANADVLFGGNGADILEGGNGADDLRGGNDLDLIEGGGGDDLLRGGDKKDIMRGQGGNDVLLGEGGNDKLRGGKGDDSLDGGDGDDNCDQGPGSGPVVNC